MSLHLALSFCFSSLAPSLSLSRSSPFPLLHHRHHQQRSSTLWQGLKGSKKERRESGEKVERKCELKNHQKEQTSLFLYILHHLSPFFPPSSPFLPLSFPLSHLNLSSFSTPSYPFSFFSLFFPSLSIYIFISFCFFSLPLSFPCHLF